MHVFYTPDIAVTCEMPEEEAAKALGMWMKKDEWVTR